MRILMVSGDRQVSIGEKGPFHAMQREFSRYFERIDVLCPRPDLEVTTRSIHDNVFFHPAECSRLGMIAYIRERGAALIEEHRPSLIVSHDYGWFYNGIGSAALTRATGVPYLSEIHHVPGYPVAADLRERFDRVVARRYISWASTRAAAFRVVNRTQMPELLRSWGVPDDKILVLPSLYIDLEVFHPAEREHRFDVTYVGRMVNNKGLIRIADALGRLARAGKPARSSSKAIHRSNARSSWFPARSRRSASARRAIRRSRPASPFVPERANRRRVRPNGRSRRASLGRP